MEAIKLSGGNPQLVFLDDLRHNRVDILDCSCFVIPGGFSAGDYPDTGVYVAEFLGDRIRSLVQARKPVLGICNGMQILMRAKAFGPDLIMGQNDCKTFVSRPILHRVLPSRCIWTKGLEGQVLQFAAAHICGKPLGDSANLNVVMKYDGLSPNGSEIAAICDDTGLVMGIMDHPERPYDNLDGQKLFQNGIRHSMK
jgi:phosphoribosylformylglycinamidine synthase